MKTIYASAILVVVLLGAVAWGPAAASTPTSQPATAAKEFFRGKDVTLVLMTSPGGAYDLIARLIAPKLKQILEARAVIVQLRGGGFVAVTNYVYNRVKPDGLTLLHFALGSRGWSQLMVTPGVEFDVRQFVPVAQFMPPPGAVLMTRGALGVKTVSDLKNLKQFRVGTTARYSDVQLLSTLLFENFGISNAKFVTGYTGSTDTMLAVERGEIEATAGVTTSSALMEARKGIESGVYGLFTIYSEKRLEAVPDVPTALQLGAWRADLKPWLEIATAISDLYNTWVLPPGTPADRVAYLRQVFEDLWADSEIKKGLNNLLQGYAMFRGGSEIEQVVKKAFPKEVLSEADRTWLRQLMDKWSR